ncbi:photosynthetic NDH subunit of subcomplex B 3, chloroplastic [Silene latifolia]|uniref:photosynthetic NDH subunit of subcomplex B 3, chloroplastic n=1 Tax=Silene latifolia TaxID=37657 RepID=UPI003D782928
MTNAHNYPLKISSKHSHFLLIIKLYQITKMMATLYLKPPCSTSLCSKCSISHNFNLHSTFKTAFRVTNPNRKPGFNTRKIRAIGTVPERDQANKPAELEEDEEEEEDVPPFIGFAFVSPVLLPDGTPDLHTRSAVGGQKLRDIMLDNNIDLYGPYGRPLLNCAGGGTCGSCMVEVVEGKDLLSRKTDKEKELLKKKPKNWRLACQTTVGEPDSRGVVVIQQLPEWKAHEWKYQKDVPSSSL